VKFNTLGKGDLQKESSEIETTMKQEPVVAVVVVVALHWHDFGMQE
jgi:hypothetical protein